MSDEFLGSRPQQLSIQFERVENPKEELQRKLDRMNQKGARCLEEAIVVYSIMANQQHTLARTSVRQTQESQRVNALDQEASWNSKTVNILAGLAGAAGVVGAGFGLWWAWKDPVVTLAALPANASADAIAQHIAAESQQTSQLIAKQTQQANSYQSIGSSAASVFNAASTYFGNMGQGERTVLVYKGDRLRLVSEELHEAARLAKQQMEKLLQMLKQTHESRSAAHSSMLRS